MSGLIPILDTNYYGIAILITCSIGCSNIASHIHSRWLFQSTSNVVRIQWVIKLLVVIWGLQFIQTSSLFDAPMWEQGVCIIPAIFIGIMAVKVEQYISRKRFNHAEKSIRYSASNHIIYRSKNSNTQGLAVTSNENKVQLKNIHEHHSRIDSEIKLFHLKDIIIVAICEELIFRGFLWKLSMNLHSLTYSYVAVLFSVILFGASHLAFGKGQFISKTFLGCCCMLSVLLLNSVLPAIIIHSVFNYYAHHLSDFSSIVHQR